MRIRLTKFGVRSLESSPVFASNCQCDFRLPFLSSRMAEWNESEGLGEPCEGASIIALELAGGKKQMTPCFSSLRVTSLLFYTLNILLKCYLIPGFQRSRS